MSHFLREMTEQILIRYQVKLMIAQLLSFATILVTIPRPHGAAPSQFYYFEKRCCHLLEEKRIKRQNMLFKLSVCSVYCQKFIKE